MRSWLIDSDVLLRVTMIRYLLYQMGTAYLIVRFLFRYAGLWVTNHSYKFRSMYTFYLYKDSQHFPLHKLDWKTVPNKTCQYRSLTMATFQVRTRPFNIWSKFWLVKIPPPTDEFQAICSLTKSIFDRENGSRQYQGQLESRIREEQAANQQVLDHCAWLESIIRESEQTRLQREPTLTHLTENQRILHRDLMLSRQKVEELESRIANQKLVNETLLRSVAPGGGDQSRALNIHNVLLENQWQRKLISILQNTLQMREKTVRDLQMTLDGTYGGGSPSCCSTWDIDGHQSNADLGTPSQKIPDGDDEETLCEQNIASTPSIGSPGNLE